MITTGSRIAMMGVLLMFVVPGAVQCAPAGGGASPKPKNAAASAPMRQPPPDAVILFDGRDLSNWHQPDGRPAAWKVADGAMTAGGGNIVTKESFGDAWIHVEFMEPDMPNAHGQEKGNSGVYVQARYEIQVLDSYGIKVPGRGDCGAIYGEYAPLVNANKPPLQWQTFDIIFRAPRVDASGKTLEQGRMTVLQNDMVIQNNEELLGPTAGGDPNIAAPGPLLLQDHGAPVKFRNVWVVPLPLKGSDAY
jgi:hypothetical protein